VTVAPTAAQMEGGEAEVAESTEDAEDDTES
jgi:hypothetical protein